MTSLLSEEDKVRFSVIILSKIIRFTKIHKFPFSVCLLFNPLSNINRLSFTFLSFIHMLVIQCVCVVCVREREMERVRVRDKDKDRTRYISEEKQNYRYRKSKTECLIDRKSHSLYIKTGRQKE